MDKEASIRGTTVYLCDRRIDMLPELLSSNLCSLRGNEERYAFSVLWTLTNDAEVVDVQFCKSIIRSRQAFTYGEAQKRIDDTSLTDQVSDNLRHLLRLSRCLRERRRAAGALSLASSEIRFRFDSERQEPMEVEEKASLDTNSMVEEWMLLANISVAERISTEFPDCAVLRRHPVPSPASFKPLIKTAADRGFTLSIESGKALAESLDRAVDPKQPALNRLLRVLATRCMTQAVYFAAGSVPLSQYLHYGLAAPLYTHFTSPIRRYADIMVHRLLAAAIGADSTVSTMLDRRKVAMICTNLNYRHKQAQYASRASVLLNTHLFFKDRQEVCEGFLIGVRRNGLQVLVPKYGLESVVVVKSSPMLQLDPESGVLTAMDGTQLKLLDAVQVMLEVEQVGERQNSRLSLRLLRPAISGLSMPPTLLETST